MEADRKARAELAQALRKARAQHVELLKKVQKARTKFEKRQHKLGVLEAEIADLMRRTFEPQRLPAGQIAPRHDNPRPARLIYNPRVAGGSAGAHRLQRMVERLQAHGIAVDLSGQTGGKTTRESAAEAAENGEYLVIVVGGDSAIEEAAAELVNSATTLGVIPVGTANNLARSMGIPLDLDAACELVASGAAHRLDVGRLVTNEQAAVEYFMESVVFGLSSVPLPEGAPGDKAGLSLLPRGIRRLLDCAPSPTAVELDGGQTIVAHSQIIAISNAPLIGKGIVITPEARMDDGLLDVTIFDGLSKAELLEHFMSIAHGVRAESPKVKAYRSRRVRVRPPVADNSRLMPELEVEVMPGALSMLIDEEPALTPDDEARELDVR